MARRRRGRAGGGAGGRCDLPSALTPSAGGGGSGARRGAPDALRRLPHPTWVADFAWINAAATPLVPVQLRGPNFAAALALRSSPACPGRAALRVSPGERAGARALSHRGPGADPSRAAERWDAGVGGQGGGSLSPCSVSAYTLSPDFPSYRDLSAEGASSCLSAGAPVSVSEVRRWPQRCQSREA